MLHCRLTVHLLHVFLFLGFCIDYDCLYVCLSLFVNDFSPMDSLSLLKYVNVHSFLTYVKDQRVMFSDVKTWQYKKRLFCNKHVGFMLKGMTNEWEIMGLDTIQVGNTEKKDKKRIHSFLCYQKWYSGYFFHRFVEFQREQPWGN